jgi:hypothetical protein
MPEMGGFWQKKIKKGGGGVLKLPAEEQHLYGYVFILALRIKRFLYGAGKYARISRSGSSRHGAIQRTNPSPSNHDETRKSSSSFDFGDTADVARAIRAHFEFTGCRKL